MATRWYESLKHSIRFWLLRKLPTCKQTVAIISQSFERPLSVRERVLLKLHFWICAWCLWYMENLQLMRNAMRGAEAKPLDVVPGLSDDARERIKRRLAGN